MPTALTGSVVSIKSQRKIKTTMLTNNILNMENDNFSIKRQNFRTLALVVSTFLYLLVGTVTFEELESHNEDSNRQLLLDEINKFRAKTPMSDEAFEELFRHLKERKILKFDPQWDFFGSFFFCVLCVTLIGYGHSTPKTRLGKIVLLIYLPLGVLLAGRCLQEIGTKINDLIRHTMSYLKRSESVATNFHIIVIEFILTLVLISTAAVFFSLNEDWTYSDSCYYSFITITTIGFGDFVPLQRGPYPTYYYLFTILFIVTGLIIVASAFNLLVVYLADYQRNRIENLRRRLNLKKQLESENVLIGDVISADNKRDIVTHMDEVPTFMFDEAPSRVCSCDDLSSCMSFSKSKIKNNISIKRLRVRKAAASSCGEDKGDSYLRQYNRFSIRSQPVNCVKHLSLLVDKSDLILPSHKDQVSRELKMLAIESDFICHRIVDRRNSK